MLKTISVQTAGKKFSRHVQNTAFTDANLRRWEQQKQKTGKYKGIKALGPVIRHNELLRNILKAES